MVMKPLRSPQGRWISKPNWMCNQGFLNKQVDQEKVDGKNNEKETHPLAWLGKQEEDSSGGQDSDVATSRVDKEVNTIRRQAVNLQGEKSCDNPYYTRYKEVDHLFKDCRRGQGIVDQ
jgi:hypothetical protein